MKLRSRSQMLPLRHPAQAVLFCLAAGLVAGCQTTGSSAQGPQGQALGERLSEADVLSEINGNVVAKAAYWGGLYEQDPRNAEAAAEYAAALRSIGSVDAALGVLRRAQSLTPDDPRLMAEHGKTLTAAGRAEEAMPLLEAAIAQDGGNWRTLTALGVALDQQARHEEARAAYRRAIAAGPGEPAPWNNLGLSYALTGHLEDAELALREAMETNKASAKMRQNLALVLGLRGDTTDAERLARANKVPAAVDGNLEELRAIVTQPALWAREANADNNPVIIE